MTVVEIDSQGVADMLTNCHSGIPWPLSEPLVQEVIVFRKPADYEKPFPVLGDVIKRGL